MYGGSGKLGRGGGGRGGGGPVKRNIHSTFQPSSLQRPSTAPGGRLSAGGSSAHRNRSSTSIPAGSAASAAEESFSLVTGNPLNYAMIIRLAPDLVEEIKRVEAQGGAARIKFDANPTNPSGNVIDVGGKDFRFTWAQEMGDLLDIYEERQSGDNGNGLLVESGGAWRKVNVQRVLDESTKNHVKMRSEEAERKLKSRRAIVLDHGNPSMKNQMKALAAAEVNPWRSYKQKKEPPSKKRKAETLSVGGPPKSASKSGLVSSAPSKVRPSTSPLLSTPERSGGPQSPFGTSSLSKGHASIENVMPTHAMSKEKAIVSEKELASGAITGAVQDKPWHKVKLGAKPTDLRSLLISLLTEKPGMNLKALEKAIGDTVPTSVRQIEPILKKIADFHAPGRYFLKLGVELESFKKPSSQNGSSPEDNQHQALAPRNNFDQVPAQEPSYSPKHDIKEIEEQEQLSSRPVEELNALEKIDIQHQSPDLFGEKKVSDNSEGPARSSSVSGSDSDSESDSSDSGSDSGSPSRSKSKSPVGSGSGSSSDSESDASSNSKQGSDEDVDIMSDDDKEPKHKSEHSEHGVLTSLIPLRAPEGGLVQNVVDEKNDGHDSDIVEIEKDLPEEDQDTEIDVVTDSFPKKGGEKPAEETKHLLPDFHEHLEYRVYTENSHSEKENVAKDRFNHEQFDISEKISKGKSKRGSEGKHFDDNPERTKRLKGESLTRPQFSGGRNSLSLGSPHGTTPERPAEGPHKGATSERTSRTVRDATKYVSKTCHNLDVPAKSISDSPMSGQRSTDLNARAKAPSIERPDKYAEGLGGSMKHSERSLQPHDGFPGQKDKVNREAQEDAYSNERRPPKISKMGSTGDKHSDSHYRKHGELIGKFKETGSISNSQFRNSPRDNNRIDTDKSPVPNGRGSILRRELSDLELGELREPLHEEGSGAKKQSERKSSFKQSENKSASDYWNLDPCKGKPAGRTSMDSSKASPPRSNIGISSNTEGLSKKKTPELYTEDSTRPQHKAIQPQAQQPSNSDHAEVGFQNNKVVEMSSKGRHNEAGVSQGNGVEGCGDTQRKVPPGAGQQHDAKRGAVPLSTKEDKKQKNNLLINTNEKRKDTSLSESNDGVLKRRESSSDENSCSYSKYEKEEAELKGPIKDFSQYKEYVQEYREKYESYCSLNTILESDRTEFKKLGRDLELAKGRDKDRYSNILRQLVESYRHCGMRHKRLKKIFIVLHEELQNLKQVIRDFAVSYTKD